MDIVDVVNKDYLDWADLFAVGAHSKSGILDFMVGSLTKNLIEYGKLNKQKRPEHAGLFCLSCTKCWRMDSAQLTKLKT